MRTPKGVARGALGNSTNKDVAKKPTAVKAVKKMGSGTSGCGGASGTPVVILPQRPPKYGSSRGGQSSSKKGEPVQVQCWAHSRAGRRCTRLITCREGERVPIPYCDAHLASGDGALKVVDHPFAGKCLVARYDLPAKYRMVYWGNRGPCDGCDKEDRAISYYPPDAKTGRKKAGDVDGYNGVLNPGGTGDIVQYAACPGPNERQNMRSTCQYWGKWNGKLGGLEFITLEAVPRNTQLCHWYGPGWWSARGVKRMDVGIPRHPAPLRVAKN